MRKKFLGNHACDFLLSLNALICSLLLAFLPQKKRFKLGVVLLLQIDIFVRPKSFGNFFRAFIVTRLITEENIASMYWTLELASYLEDAPWPATKDELIDFAMRTGAPLEVVENLQEIEDEGEQYDTIEDIWPDYPTKDDFLFNEDEY